MYTSLCRCFVTTVLKTHEELLRDEDGVDRGSVNFVKDVPDKFKEWVTRNADRIAKAETPEQIQEIQDRLAKREKQYERIRQRAEKMVKLASDYGELSTSELVRAYAKNDLMGMERRMKELAKTVGRTAKAERELSDLIFFISSKVSQSAPVR